MQPFEKHPADPATLQSYGDQLVESGAQALQLGQSTRQAYSPAVPSVQGVPAPAVAAAPIPVDQASRASSGSMVWGAIATQYWGQQVYDFNAKVDQIVADMEAEEAAVIAKYDAQGTPGAVPGGGPTPTGQTQNAQDTAEALERIAVTMRAREKWQQAHDEHIVAGGAQAAAMLAQGPTGANQQVARDAGVMPEMEFTLLMQVISKSGARIGAIRPDGQGPLADVLFGTERLLNGLSYADKIWWSRNMRFFPQGVPQPPGRTSPLRLGIQRPLPGPGQFPPGTPYADKVKAWNSRTDWGLRPGVPASAGATRDFFTAASKIAKPLGAVVAGAAGAIDQWTRDEGRTDVGDGERAARSALRGGAAAGGTLAGAALGAKGGGAAGFAVGGPWGAAIGGVGGAVVGGIAGGAAVNELVDKVLYAVPPRTRVVAPGPDFTPVPQPGGLGGPV